MPSAQAGILEIALASPEPQRGNYLAVARRYLDILLAPAVLFTPAQSDALLQNGTTSFPQIGIALPYGDYYLFEAVRAWDALPQRLAEAATAAAAAM